VQSFETREVEVRQKLNEAAKVVAESSLGAALVGFLHSRFEDADANFFIPRTSPTDVRSGMEAGRTHTLIAPKAPGRPLPLNPAANRVPARR
jgi:hypothetical protein